MARRNYSNTAPVLALTSGINASQTTMPVGSTAGYPAPPFTIGIERGTANEEICLVTAMDATTFTAVQRGYDGTVARAHDINKPVEHVTSAQDFDEANAHTEDDTRDDHGQYMRADGTRHDETARHPVGTVIPRGTAGDLGVETIGATASRGSTATVADAGHRHAMPSAATFRDAVFPPGTVIMHVGATLPDGWLYCRGGSVSKATYPNLYAALGGTSSPFGGDPGAGGNFNLPDFRGRLPFAARPDQGFPVGTVDPDDHTHTGVAGGGGSTGGSSRDLIRVDFIIKT